MGRHLTYPQRCCIFDTATHAIAHCGNSSARAWYIVSWCHCIWHLGVSSSLQRPASSGSCRRSSPSVPKQFVGTHSPGFLSVDSIHCRCFRLMLCGFWCAISVTRSFGTHSIYEQVLTIWGLIGIHTDKFGFKHVWEIWYEPTAWRTST